MLCFFICGNRNNKNSSFEWTLDLNNNYIAHFIGVKLSYICLISEARTRQFTFLEYISRICLRSLLDVTTCATFLNWVISHFDYLNQPKVIVLILTWKLTHILYNKVSTIARIHIFVFYLSCIAYGHHQRLPKYYSVQPH